MVELTYNGHRYMVENGQWYRRLEAGEVKPDGYQRDDTDIDDGWRAGKCIGYPVDSNTFNYRVPCTDPRPAFTVGQRVKVARADENWEWYDQSDEEFIGETGVIRRPHPDGDLRIHLDKGYMATFPPWCLDPVEPKELLDELAQQAQETGMYDDDDVPYTRPPMKVVGRYICHKVPEGPQPDGMPCLDWVLTKLSRQPEKAERTREILQRAMGELVRLESDV